MSTDLVIIGAGLSGLCTAYFLKDLDITIHIVEARKRVGGRIHTLGYETDQPVEMGATWLGSKHRHLRELIQELEISTFEQLIGTKAIYEPISTSPPYHVDLPANGDPSFRISGGTEKIIRKLADQIDNHCEIHMNTTIQSMKDEGDHLHLQATNGKSFSAKHVVSTLPPNLMYKSFKESIDHYPELIDTLRSTHTWMGDSIKVSLTYRDPFWRKGGSTGTIFSNVGPIPEMYDHSNFEENHFALMGFLNGSYYGISKEERLELILNQLTKYYGKQAAQYIDYHETVWRNEEYTFQEYDSYVVPHQNNGHKAFHSAYMSGRLLISGTETAAFHPGYMEGAVYSAKTAANWIKKNNK